MAVDDLIWVLILSIFNIVVGCVFGYLEGKRRAYLEILEMMKEHGRVP